MVKISGTVRIERERLIKIPDHAVILALLDVDEPAIGKCQEMPLGLEDLIEIPNRFVECTLPEIGHAPVEEGQSIWGQLDRLIEILDRAVVLTQVLVNSAY